MRGATEISSGPRPRRAMFFGWRVVGAAFVIAVFAWGVGFYGPSVFLGALHLGRGWSVSVISTAITCHFLISAAIVARLPSLHHRFSVAGVTRAGAVSISLGMLLWALPGQPWQLFPAAALTGAGFAVTSGAAINTMIAPWFERKRPAALATAYNGASLGGAVFAPLWVLLIAKFGFVGAAATIGAATVVTLWWLASRFLRSSPAALGLFPDGDAAAGNMAAVVPARAAEPRAPLPFGAVAWRDQRFTTLSIGFALGFFAQIGLIVNLVLLAAPVLGETGAGVAVSLVTVCAVLGRTLFAMLAPVRTDWRIAAGANFGMQAAGTLALLAAGNSAPLFLLGCALFGLGVGNLISFLPLIAAAEFTPTDVARVVALATAVNQATYAFAPVLLGALRDLTGGGFASLIATGLAQVGGASAVLAGRRKRPTSPP